MKAGSVLLPIIATMLMVAGSGEAGDARPGVTIEPRYTWSTAMGPEAHVLLRNRGAAPIEFTIRFERRNLQCAGGAVDSDGGHSGPDEFHRSASSGVAPPHGWAHRSHPLALDPATLPCSLPIRVVLSGPDGAVFDEVLQIDHGPRHRATGSPDPDKLVISMVTETDACDDRLLVLRTLLENPSRVPVAIEAAQRGTSCSDIGFTPLHGVLQGENTGPITVESGGWAVLVDVIRGPRRADFSACRAWLSMEGSAAGEPPKSRRLEFQLAPTGEFGCSRLDQAPRSQP